MGPVINSIKFSNCIAFLLIDMVTKQFHRNPDIGLNPV